MSSYSHSDSDTRVQTALFVVVCAVFVLFRLWDISAYGLWLDEIISLETARQPILGLFKFAVDDIVQPPLFYIILKVWIDLGGESTIWLKLLPLTTSLLTIWPFCVVCKELGAKPTERNLALFLIAANAYLIYYSQELRMYSLVFLLSVASIANFLRFMNTQGKLAPLFFTNLLMIYTHYFGWFIVGVEILALILYKRDLVARLSKATVYLALLFSPWMCAVVISLLQKEGVRNIGWIAVPGIHDVVYFYAILSGFIGGYAGLIGLGILSIIIGWNIIRLRRDAVILLLFSSVPTIASFLISLRLPIWHPRYLIICAAPFLLLGAVSIFSIRGAEIRKVLVVFFVVWTGFAGISGIKKNERIDWREIARVIRTADRPSATIYALGNDQTAVPLKYYLKSGFNIEKTETLPLGSGHWVVYRESRENKMPPLEDIVLGRGGKVSDQWINGQSGHAVHVFYVEDQ